MLGFEFPLKAIMEMRTMVKQALELTQPLQAVALAQETMRAAQKAQQMQVANAVRTTQELLEAHQIR